MKSFRQFRKKDFSGRGGPGVRAVRFKQGWESRNSWAKRPCHCDSSLPRSLKISFEEEAQFEIPISFMPDSAGASCHGASGTDVPPVRSSSQNSRAKRPCHYKLPTSSKNHTPRFHFLQQFG